MALLSFLRPLVRGHRLDVLCQSLPGADRVSVIPVPNLHQRLANFDEGLETGLAEVISEQAILELEHLSVWRERVRQHLRRNIKRANRILQTPVLRFKRSGEWRRDRYEHEWRAEEVPHDNDAGNQERRGGFHCFPGPRALG